MTNYIENEFAGGAGEVCRSLGYILRAPLISLPHFMKMVEQDKDTFSIFLLYSVSYVLNMYVRFVKVAVLDRCLVCFEVCQTGSPTGTLLAWLELCSCVRYVILFNQKAAG